MNCVYCASPTKVINSRSRAGGTQTWRRRECVRCHGVWTTHEIIDPTTVLRVDRGKKRTEAFSRDKLFLSIMNSLSHRKTALNDATGLTDTILSHIYTQKSALVTPDTIAHITYEILYRLDHTAAAVYQATHGL